MAKLLSYLIDFVPWYANLYIFGVLFIAIYICYSTIIYNRKMKTELRAPVPIRKNNRRIL